MAVKVTGCPSTEGFEDDPRVMTASAVTVTAAVATWLSAVASAPPGPRNVPPVNVADALPLTNWVPAPDRDPCTALENRDPPGAGNGASPLSAPAGRGVVNVPTRPYRSAVTIAVPPGAIDAGEAPARSWSRVVVAGTGPRVSTVRAELALTAGPGAASLPHQLSLAVTEPALVSCSIAVPSVAALPANRLSLTVRAPLSL